VRELADNFIPDLTLFPRLKVNMWMYKVSWRYQFSSQVLAEHGINSLETLLKQSPLRLENVRTISSSFSFMLTTTFSC
jgi:hypothetical protein